MHLHNYTRRNRFYWNQLTHVLYSAFRRIVLTMNFPTANTLLCMSIETPMRDFSSVIYLICLLLTVASACDCFVFSRGWIIFHFAGFIYLIDTISTASFFTWNKAFLLKSTLYIFLTCVKGPTSGNINISCPLLKTFFLCPPATANFHLGNDNIVRWEGGLPVAPMVSFSAVFVLERYHIT